MAQQRDLNKNDATRLFKTIRNDEYDFWPCSIEGIIGGQQMPLRTGEKKRFKLYTDGTIIDKQSTPRVGYCTPAQKQGFSKFQSTSYCSSDYFPPAFGHNKDRNDCLVGISIPILPCYLIKIEDFDTKQEQYKSKFLKDDHQDKEHIYIRTKDTVVYFNRFTQEITTFNLTPDQLTTFDDTFKIPLQNSKIEDAKALSESEITELRKQLNHSTNNPIPQYFSRYDGGTIGRRYYFHSEKEAEARYKLQKGEGIYHDSLQSLKNASKNDDSQNEILARLQWTPHSRVTIFTDNRHSRLLAQARALDLQATLKTKEKYKDYPTVEIDFYDKKNQCFNPYLQKEREKDLEDALKSENETEQALAIIIMIQRAGNVSELNIPTGLLLTISSLSLRFSSSTELKIITELPELYSPTKSILRLTRYNKNNLLHVLAENLKNNPKTDISNLVEKITKNCKFTEISNAFHEANIYKKTPLQIYPQLLDIFLDALTKNPKTVIPTLLKEAIENNDDDSFNLSINIIKKQLDPKAYIDTPLLKAAVEKKNIAMVKQLIEINPSCINPKNADEKTPLVLAIEQENSDLIKILLQHGANGHDYRIINIALKQNDLELLKIALDKNYKKLILSRKQKKELDDILYNRYNTDYFIKKIVTMVPIFFKIKSSGSQLSPYQKAVLKNSDKEKLASSLIKFVCELTEYETKSGYNGSALHHALGKNNIELAKTLIETNLCDFLHLAYDKPSNQDFLKDIFLELSELNDIIQQKYTNHFLTLKDSNGNTPLHLAISNGHTEIAKLIITKLTNDAPALHSKNNQGKSVLDLAVKTNNHEIVELLLKKGIGAYDDYTLNIASTTNTKLLEIFFRLGNTKTKNNIMESLTEDPKKLKTVFDRTTIGLKDKNGRTVLHYLALNAYKQKTKTDEILNVITEINDNFDTFTQDTEGNTAFHLALLNKKFPQAKALFSYETEKETLLTLRNNDNNTPLHLSVRNKDSNKITEKLLQESKIENLLIQNNKNKTPLHEAITSNNKEAVEAILEKYPTFITEKFNGETLLAFAIRNKSYDCCQAIVNNLAKKHYDFTTPQTPEGETPLQLAAIAGDLKIFQLIATQQIETLKNKEQLKKILDLAENHQQKDIINFIRKLEKHDSLKLTIQEYAELKNRGFSFFDRRIVRHNGVWRGFHKSNIALASEIKKNPNNKNNILKKARYNPSGSFAITLEFENPAEAIKPLVNTQKAAINK